MSNRYVDANRISEIFSFKNYITNGLAFKNTDGWATYADASQAAPVDGTGGSPTVTWTRSTSAPLRDEASFLFTKDAANRRGEGASDLFTIDVADQAKVLSISLEYNLLSGTYSNGTPDVTVWIYDVTNAVLIQPSSFNIDAASTTNTATFRAQFQSNANSVSYRLIFHCATTSASAFVLKFDNIQIGPQSLGATSAIISQAAYTTVLNSNTGVASQSFFISRVGNMAIIDGRVTYSGGGAASAFTFSLPTGLSIDTTLITGTAVTNGSLGWGRWYDDSGTDQLLVPAHSSATTLSLRQQGVAGNFNTTGVANLDVITVHAEVPILGWGAAVSLLGADSARTVSARFTTTDTTGIASSVSAVVIWNATSFDSHNARVGNTYVVPVSGRYKLNAVVRYAASTNVIDQFLQLTFRRNTSTTITTSTMFVFTATSTRFQHSIADQVDLVAGDVIDLLLNNQSSTTKAMSGSAADNYWSIERIAGPEAIGAGENILLEVSRIIGQSMVISTPTTVLYDQVRNDSHGAYVAATGRWTCPQARPYTLSFGSGWVANATGNRATRLIRIRNAVTTTIASTLGPASGSNILAQSGSISTALLAGDIIFVQVEQNGLNPLSMYNDADNYTYFSISG